MTKKTAPGDDPVGQGRPGGATEGIGNAFQVPNSKVEDQGQYVPRDLKGVPIWIWHRDGPSRAAAHIVVSCSYVELYIPWCPHCSDEHWHGGCALDKGDPRHAFAAHDGWRSPHCSAYTDTYRLVWSGAPAVFYPGDARHPATRAAMKRLKRMGIPTSDKTLKLRRRKSGMW